MQMTYPTTNLLFGGKQRAQTCWLGWHAPAAAGIPSATNRKPGGMLRRGCRSSVRRPGVQLRCCRAYPVHDRAGVGRPKLKQLVFPTTGQSFLKCMDAVRSNTLLGSTITLVLERDDGVGEGLALGPSGPGGAAQQGPPSTPAPSNGSPSSTFDASLFE